MDKQFITWEQVYHELEPIDKKENKIFGVPNGGMIACSLLKYAEIVHNPEKANIIIDDIYDSGQTQEFYNENYPNKMFMPLFYKEDWKDCWLTFPWEVIHPKQFMDISNNVTRLLQYIGEDVTREGLKQTPERVINSYIKIFEGYNQKVEDIITTFTSEGYDEIVLLKDIEFYSMCEHHMLPFFGKAHVAYIPDKTIIGISKLARIVNIYARRLQNQERLTEQIAKAVEKHLEPKGAACIITEAEHMCMKMRGVEKHETKMVTSCMRGAFFSNPAARAELINLINK